jgi:hypothetical protein
MAADVFVQMVDATFVYFTSLGNWHEDPAGVEAIRNVRDRMVHDLDALSGEPTDAQQAELCRRWRAQRIAREGAPIWPPDMFIESVCQAIDLRSAGSREAPVEPPLALGEQGRYADLARRRLPAGLVFMFIPGLAAILRATEEGSGYALNEKDVLRIRDEYRVVVIQAEVAALMENARGYADLDPADPWTGWLKLKGRSGSVKPQEQDARDI